MKALPEEQSHGLYSIRCSTKIIAKKMTDSTIAPPPQNQPPPKNILKWRAADATFTPVLAVPSGATPPESPPRAPTPPSEAAVALLPTGRISTRTRRRTAVAAGAVQPAVDYGFGPGRVPRTSSSRVDPPPRVLRPLLPLAAAPSASMTVGLGWHRRCET